MAINKSLKAINQISEMGHPCLLKVLMVEDSDDDARLIMRHLTKEGYQPVYERVDSSVDMKKALQSKLWDVILCDYNMPEFNAPSALDQMKELGLDIPVIIVSGAVGEEKAVECMKLGARDFIMKSNLSRLCPAIEREITERDLRKNKRQAESQRAEAIEALKESERQYRSILENMQEGYYECDLAGNYTFVNRAICTHFGYSREELIGMNYRNLQTETEAEQTYQAFHEIYKTGKPVKSVVSEFRRKDGAQVIYELSASIRKHKSGKTNGFCGIARDITDRKQAEMALKKSEEMLRLITENMSDMIRVTDFQGTNLYASPSHYKTIGYRPEDRVGKSTLDIVHPEDLEDVIIKLEEGLVSGQPVRFEYRIKHADGHYVWLDTVGDFVRDDQGKPKAAIMISRDVSERKLAEEKLQQSEERYRMIVENMNDSITTLDMHFKPTYISPSEIRLTGFTPEEAMQLTPEQVMTPESRTVVKQVIEKAFSEEAGQVTGDARCSVNMDLEIYHKNGYTVWQEVTASMTKDEKGKSNGILLVSRDITERKKVEAALRESESRYRSIFNNSAEGIFQNNPEGKFVMVNPAMVKILGYDSEEDLMTSSRMLINSCVDPSALISLYGIIKNQSHVNDYEMKVYRKNRDIIDVSLNAHCVCDESGNILYYEGMIFDITEKKRIDELKMAKELAEQSDKAKSEFLANMSHEIRTPMNAVVGFTGLALKQELSAKVRDYLKKIDHSASSLLILIDDILDFSKMEAGQLRFENIPFNLRDVFDKIGDLLSIKSAQKGIELIISIARDVPCELVGDPLRLEQILINLTNNAIKFTESGHIILRADVLKKDGHVCKLQFNCSDTGVGMSEEQLSKIFNAFSQADSSVTRKYGGTGLGLAISKRLVEMMRGDISAKSDIDQGSTFKFTAEFILQQVEKDIRFTVPADLQNLRVLVADDNKVVRDVFIEQLESFEFQAYAVKSGPEAIQELERAQIAKERSYDLVLMDWLMEGMDGLEAARRIKQNKKLSKIPIIIMITAFGREEILKTAEAESVIDAYIMKPANESNIFSTILEVFDKNNRRADKGMMASIERSGKKTIESGKILLVEDNAINQELAMEILQSAGFEVDIANNGQEAIDAVKTKDYDAVLMDVQMPVMSGYKASELIRQDSRFKQLPIIAMTAYAMSGAREQCLNAGMNDYISKPIHPDKLFSVLGKWMKPESVEKTRCRIKKGGSTNRRKKDEQIPRSITGIDIPTGLKRASGNKTLYVKLLLDFADQFVSVKDEIQTALRQGDLKTAEHLAHALKGVAGNISAVDVQEAARKLEDVIGEKNTQAYEPLLSEMDKIIRRVCLSIKRDLDHAVMEKKPKGKRGNSADVTPVMMTLAGYLRKSDPNAQVTMGYLRDLLDGSINQQEIDEMARYVDNYDFDIAMTSLEKIAQKMKVSLNG